MGIFQAKRQSSHVASRLATEILASSSDLDIRVPVYNYGHQSVQDLHDIAMVFKDKLIAIREYQQVSSSWIVSQVSAGIMLNYKQSYQKRVPLVFLAHSLGGLVLKQALVYLSKQPMPQQEPFLSTYAILFFGVPSYGLAGERLGLAAMATGQTTQGFLSDMRLDSRTVHTLAQDFREAFKDRPFLKIFSFYETLESATAIMVWLEHSRMAEFLIDICRSTADPP